MRTFASILLWTVCPFSLLTASAQSKSDTTFRIIGFYRGGYHEMLKYDVDKLTHLVFGFTYLKGNKIAFNSTFDEETLRRLVKLKKKHPKLKVLISFGGWGGCETCSDVFATEKNRTIFAASVRDMLLKYHADGFDVDWESPVIGGYKKHKASNDDKANFTALLKTLRKQLPAGSELCFDANSFAEYLTRSVDWKEVMPYVDFVNLMTYTLPYNQSHHTGHHAALYSSPDQTESADLALRYLDSIRAPLNKIAIGAAFYGMLYEQVDSVNNGLYQTGKFKSYVDYSNIAASYLYHPDYQYAWDSLTQAPCLFSRRLGAFITFDDKKSVGLKTDYALQKKLAGIMFWRLNGDLFSDGLLDAIYERVKRK